MWKKLFLLVLSFSGYSQENPQGQTLVFGSPFHPWSEFSLDGLQEKPGPRGVFLTLQDRTQTLEQKRSADLLLGFDDINTLYGSYELKSPANITRQTVRMGTGSGVFQGNSGGLGLKAGPASLFWPGTLWHNFSIEFWLYLPSVSEGSTIMVWRGAHRRDGAIVPQEFRVSIKSRKLEIRFLKFFIQPVENERSQVVLTGRTPLLPGRWYHHHFNFDSARGLLEYFKDGQVEESIYVTSTGREGGQVYYPFVGELSEPQIFLGSGLTALMDDFMITRTVPARVETASLDISRGSPSGTAVSPLIDLGDSGHVLDNIRLRGEIPSQTLVGISVKVGDALDYQWSRSGAQSSGLPGEWITWPLARGSAPLRGRFFQLRFTLRGDGGGEKSPKLETAEIATSRILAPEAPGFVSLRYKELENALEMSWRPLADFNVNEYRVYWSLRPGRMEQTRYFTVPQVFGSALSYDAGERPRVRTLITPEKFQSLGENEIATALREGQIVYFTVTASAKLPGQYSSGVIMLSPYSQEVSGRWMGE